MWKRLIAVYKLVRVLFTILEDSLLMSKRTQLLLYNNNKLYNIKLWLTNRYILALISCRSVVSFSNILKERKKKIYIKQDGFFFRFTVHIINIRRRAIDIWQWNFNDHRVTVSERCEKLLLIQKRAIVSKSKSLQRNHWKVLKIINANQQI